MFEEYQEVRTAMNHLEATLVLIQGGLDPTTEAAEVVKAKVKAQTLIDMMVLAELGSVE